MKIISIIVSLVAVSAFANPTAPVAASTTTTTTHTMAAASHDSTMGSMDASGDGSMAHHGKMKKVEKKTTTETKTH